MASTTTIYTSGGVPQLQQLNTAWAQTTAVYYPKLFPKLNAGQTPEIFWVGCCDSRVPETTLLGLLPGEVFVHRNIANLANPDDNSLPAALEYAVEHNNVKHIIVCGHLQCGGIAGACGSALVGIPAVDTWLGPLRALRYTHMSMLSGKSPADEQAALVKINVANSVAKITADPVVADALGKGAVQVHGAIYDVGTGLLNFLSAADVAVPPADPLYYAFNYTWWFNVTNAASGTGRFFDIQNRAVQCSGTGGNWPNQIWKFTPTSEGALVFSTQGFPGNVATVDPKTLLVSMQPPLTGNATTQHFRPLTLNGGQTWNFTSDFLPSSFQLTIDPASLNVKMSSTPGQGVDFIFHSLNKV